MAGVTLSKSRGAYRVLFGSLTDPAKRLQISLGKVTKANAEGIRRKVEELRGSRLAGETPRDGVLDWLATVPDTWHAKFVGAGLARPRKPAEPQAEVKTLGALVAHFKARSQWKGITEGTRGTYERSFRHMLKRFPADTPIDGITRAEAKDFRAFLEGKKPEGCGLAISTASATITQVKTLFELAVDDELLNKNPFRKIKTPQPAAEKADISAEAAREIMAKLPNVEWRLAFALARWGGLRMISEIEGMTWADVDFELLEILVRSPKTKRYPNGHQRFVPMFDEILPLMRARFDEAQEGEVYVLPIARRCKTTLRNKVIKAAKDAGHWPWAELFNSLRASCENELFRERHALTEVADAIGHSLRTAEKNYKLLMSSERREAMRQRAHRLRTAEDDKRAPADAASDRAHFDERPKGRPDKQLRADERKRTHGVQTYLNPTTTGQPPVEGL